MKQQMKTRYLIRRFLPYYKKYQGIVYFDLFCAALTTVCELVFPLLVRRITTLAVSAPAELTISFVGKISLVYLILRLVDTAANYYMADVGHVMGTRMESDMRHDLFSHLQKLSYSYYTETKVGQIMARITSDLFDITEFAHHCPEELFITGLKIVVSFLILLRIHVLLTLTLFLILPLMLFCSMRFREKMRSAFKESRVQVGEINAQVEDSLLGVRVVKSFANEPIEQEKFDRGNKRFFDVKKIAYRYMAGFQTTTRFFEGILNLSVLAAGSIFLIRGKITAGDLVAYLLYVTTLIASIRTLIQFTEQFQRGMTGIERFLEIMDIAPEMEDQPDAKDFSEGDIVFHDVSFHYPDHDKNVLTSLNLRIPKGKSVALVGPSGSGKTTLCNLIPRFYHISSGKITFG